MGVGGKLTGDITAAEDVDEAGVGIRLGGVRRYRSGSGRFIGLSSYRSRLDITLG